MVLNKSWCGTCNLSLLLLGLFSDLLSLLAPAGVSIAGNLVVKKEPQSFFALFLLGAHPKLEVALISLFDFRSMSWKKS